MPEEQSENMEFQLKALYIQIAICVVIELGIIWSIVEIKGLEHRTKLKYSNQLPSIRSAEDTDKNAKYTFQLALASNTIFIAYLSLATHRLK